MTKTKPTERNAKSKRRDDARVLGPWHELPPFPYEEENKRRKLTNAEALEVIRFVKEQWDVIATNAGLRGAQI